MMASNDNRTEPHSVYSITAVKSINLSHPVQKLQQKQKKINQEQYNI